MREKTPQDRGRDYEKRRAKQEGLSLHPGSGSGRIKHDASDKDRLVEFKSVAKSFTLNGAYLKGLRDQGVRIDKEAILEVEFVEANITAVITIISGTR